jgi:hypothetical protein
MKNENAQTLKQEQPVLQGRHPSEALTERLAGFEHEATVQEEEAEWLLGAAMSGVEEPCESCQ